MSTFLQYLFSATFSPKFISHHFYLLSCISSLNGWRQKSTNSIPEDVSKVTLCKVTHNLLPAKFFIRHRMHLNVLWVPTPGMPKCLHRVLQNQLLANTRKSGSFWNHAACFVSQDEHIKFSKLRLIGHAPAECTNSCEVSTCNDQISK